MTEAEALEVLRAKGRELIEREPVRRFVLGVHIASTLLWVARAEVEGDTFARRVAVTLERWGRA